MNTLPIVDQDEINLYTGDLESDVQSIGTLKRALEIIGGLSKPDKMPCYAYNIPASRCKLGGRLKTIKGSVCFGCYAADELNWVKRKCEANGKWALTRYTMKTVQSALERRYQCLNNPLWVPAMVYVIRHYAKNKKNKQGVKFFRWHDSGDVQTNNHFRNIITVCENTPEVKHWLPTREYGIVTKFSHPENLCVRLSAHMVDSLPPSKYGIPTSTVSTTDLPILGNRCQAPNNDGKCGDCRDCWDQNVENVDYHHHNQGLDFGKIYGIF